jgi:REP element-mobilizing transposase RayT
MHRCIREVFFKIGDEADRFRLIHYSVQTNHLHMVVEASDRDAMTRGMRRIGIRLALQLNKRMGRARGRVLSDRYDEKHLETPSQVRNAIGYVLCNFRKHYFQTTGGMMLDPNWLDPYSSAAAFDGWQGLRREKHAAVARGPCAEPLTWLVQLGWRRRGLIPCELLPGGKLAAAGPSAAVERRRPGRHRAFCQGA